MTKKACNIYRVRYAQGKRKYISHVEAQIIRDDGSSTGQKELTRNDVIVKINDGYATKTRIREHGDTYKDGASVLVWSVKGVNYLKTEPNDDEEDNLGELPLF